MWKRIGRALRRPSKPVASTEEETLKQELRVREGLSPQNAHVENGESGRCCGFRWRRPRRVLPTAFDDGNIVERRRKKEAGKGVAKTQRNPDPDSGITSVLKYSVKRCPSCNDLRLLSREPTPVCTTGLEQTTDGNEEDDVVAEEGHSLRQSTAVMELNPFEQRSKETAKEKEEEEKEEKKEEAEKDAVVDGTFRARNDTTVSDEPQPLKKSKATLELTVKKRAAWAEKEEEEEKEKAADEEDDDDETIRESESSQLILYSVSTDDDNINDTFAEPQEDSLEDPIPRSGSKLSWAKKDSVRYIETPENTVTLDNELTRPKKPKELGFLDLCLCCCVFVFSWK